MAIRVVNVVGPAAGQDWSYTIPGQYNVTLVAVSATLTTTANPTTGIDANGNTRPLTYQNNGFVTYGTTGPFAGGTNRAVTQAAGAHSTGTQIASRPASTDWNLATFSIGAWIKLGAASQSILWQADSVVGVNHQGLVFGNLSGIPNQVFLQWLNGVFRNSTGTFSTGAWHLIGCTYDGTTLVFYIDGVAAGSFVVAVTEAAIPEPMLVGGGDNIQSLFELNGAMCGLFVNGAALAPGRWGTYFTDATTVGAAQYQADVLADSPLALWMMAETQTQTSRTATLTITDGTNLVGRYPGGTITGSAASFQWTWSALGAALGQSPNGQVNLVPIPDLVLPAGYTIGTTTLDLVGTDRWGPISLWFDDGTGPGGGGGGGGPGSFQYENILIIG